ncbi:aminopeptidase M1-A-like [Zingiber officinale]|uniref:aminopeptidase M1-A-like n=1 Tax=Zingiber officinale TaxID=94328 RepID=UPI001C4B0891|nr:aminopeptidase M1-A-like [Zingiber officinale]
MDPLKSLSNFNMIKSLIFMILLFLHQNSQAHEGGIVEVRQLQQNVEQFKGQLRLPKFAIPHNYNISISVDFSQFTFLGAIEITIDIVSPTKYLVLNFVDLVIEHDSIWFGGGLGCNGEHPSNIVEVKEDEILIIGFDDILPIGKGILGIRYNGTINDQLRGFYASAYEQYGEMQTMLVTQFEPTDARRCFPCWDEPAFKATFKIALEVPSNLVALSNMPAISEKYNGLVKTVYFQESPIMSTYLVAFVIGSLDYIETYSPDGLKIRVYASVGKSNRGKFALDLAVKTLDLYKRYFSIPYGLPKLDMVGVPSLRCEGMENYGLIIYRETYLLYDELLSSQKDKQEVADTVAHELAHQWLGNLVTMEWWSDLWLNEAFATWMAHSVINDFFPEWNMWIQLLDDTLESLELDALDEYHPIQVNMTYGIDPIVIFDPIVYNKGAIVILMVQSYLGNISFQKSLDTYIKRYSFTNAKTEDLWSVFQEETKEPFEHMMYSWTKQKGYPVVNVMIKENILEISQSHFLLDGSSSDSQWIIPITLSQGSYDSPKTFLLDSKSSKLNLTDQGNQENSQTTWIKLNMNQVGLYKVQYDDELTTRLRNAIQANQLSAMDKYGLLDDYFSLCKATKQTLSSFLSLLNAYREETNPFILRRIGMAVYVSIMQTVNTTNRFGYEFLLKVYKETDDGEKENWDEKISKKLSGKVLSNTVSYIVKVFGTSEKATEISNFFKSRSNPLISDTLRQSLKQVMIKERWIQSVKNEFTLCDTIKDLVRKAL